MYRLIVRHVVRRAFRRIRPETIDGVLGAFTDESLFTFYGNHALGGRDAVRDFFDRTFRLFPDIRLEPMTVVASGPPWDTVAATRFELRATLPDGATYRNEGMQFLRLRWGRVVEDRLYEDTQRLVRALDHLAELGHEEAHAPPLGSVAESDGAATIATAPRGASS